MFVVLDGWARPIRVGSQGILVTVILIIGALSPASEFARAALWPTWKPDLQHSLFEVSHDEASHDQSPNYLANLPPGSLLARVLQTPANP